MMKYLKTGLVSIIIIVSITVAGNNSLLAQNGRKILTLEDVQLWRNNSVSLSDNGKWYTVNYSLSERPESNNTSGREKKDTTNTDPDFYGPDARTGVLYICNDKKEIIHAVTGGTAPQFSPGSGWIAYRIEPEETDRSNGREKTKNLIELRNLATGFTKQYESEARYYFTEANNYFITSDKNSLLLFDLDNLMEYYIGNTGEFLEDKKSGFIAYTISSEDKRGNGIYLFDMQKKTTMPLQTGNFIYSNLSWNSDRTAIAALKYNQEYGNGDYANMNIVTVSGINSPHPSVNDYRVEDFAGMPDNMGIAPHSGNYQNNITWSNDGERLFIKIKEYESASKKDKEDAGKKGEDEPTVDIWHWKDKKILSEEMVEAGRTINEVYDAILVFESKKIIPLSGEDIQRLLYSEGTDMWAVGMDNRHYISDWDVRKNDLYRINLETGEKNLIQKEYNGSVELSPDGEDLVLWIDGNYWCYNFEKDTRTNISAAAPVSFIDTDNDHFGSSPSYGFAGWVKDMDAVIVNHRLDLWLLTTSGSTKPENLTLSKNSEPGTRFRIEDLSFSNKPEIEERYIDLSAPLILGAFNVDTKYAGYYSLENRELKKLIYKPASFTASRFRSGLVKAKNADVLLFKMGDYTSFPEAYITNTGFSKPEKITSTNPQQANYNWGHRILIDYTNDDGVPLQGVLSIPDDYRKGQKLPMIVYSYEKMSQNMFSYPSVSISGSGICEMLYVSDGYLYLLPDIHFNVGTPHSDMHECIDAAIEKVIQLGYVDEDHIGYEGFSFGGHCGMYISTQDNRFAAIAAGAGVSNLVQGFTIDIVGDGSNEQDYYMTGQGRLGTDPTSDTEMFIRESAVFNARNMNTPLLLFHGTADNVVQWEHSFGFYSILRYLQKPVVFLSYRGEGHGLRKKSNRLDIQTRLKEYFDHYLKGKEAGEWMTLGVPYSPGETSGEREAGGRTLPAWK